MHSQIPGPYAQPQAKQRGKGCLYAFIGGMAMLVLLGACGVMIAASSSDPGAPSNSAAEGAPDASGDKGNKDSKGDKGDKKVTNGIGREYRDGKFGFTVTKVKKGVQQVGNEILGQTAQGQFILVSVTVENIGDEARTFSSAGQVLYDTKDRKFQADAEAAIAMGDKSKAFLEEINPGNSVKGILVFDVPKGVDLKSIELHDSMFSGGVTIPLGKS